MCNLNKILDLEKIIYTEKIQQKIIQIHVHQINQILNAVHKFISTFVP